MNTQTTQSDSLKAPPAAPGKKNRLIMLCLPVIVAVLLLLVPTPAGLEPYAWHFFAIFVGVIVGLIFEPLPGAVIGLTGVVVIMLDMAGIAPTAAIADRVDNTLLGSGMALLGYLLWPTWERTQTRHALAEMLRGYVAYLQGLGRQAEPDAIRDLRIAVRIARGNARASLERLRSEPGTPEQLQTVCTGLLAQGNRLARALMTFEAIQQDHRLCTDATCWQSFIQWYASQLQALALAVDIGEAFQLAPRPASADITGQTIGSLPVAATERLVETLDALIKAWNRGRSPAPANAEPPAP